MLELDYNENESWRHSGYRETSIWNESYYEGFCQGRREVMTEIAIEYYREYLKTVQEGKQLKHAHLSVESIKEINRFEQKYGRLTPEKLSIIINQESEYLIRCQFREEIR